MEIVNHMLTSMLKNVDQSVYRAVELYLNDELPLGTTEALGLKEGAVGLANNQYFDKFLEENPDIAERLDELEQMILEGEISVSSAFGMTNEELNAIRDAAK
jgi:basic membrane protein A